MPHLHPIDLKELQIEEDLPLQHSVWRFERVGWRVLGMFVTMGLAGAFGGGPLSWGEIADPAGTLAVRYERFVHNDTQTMLELRPSGSASDGMRWIALSADYASRIRIERVMPEPERTVVTGREVRLGFDPEQAGAQGMVTITLTPAHAGLLRAELRSGNAPPLRFVQFVYP